MALSLKIYEKQDRAYQILDAGAFSDDERAIINDHHNRVELARRKSKILTLRGAAIPTDMQRLIDSPIPKVLDLKSFQVLVQPLKSTDYK